MRYGTSWNLYYELDLYPLPLTFFLHRPVFIVDLYIYNLLMFFNICALVMMVEDEKLNSRLASIHDPDGIHPLGNHEHLNQS